MISSRTVSYDKLLEKYGLEPVECRHEQYSTNFILNLLING